MATPPTTVTDLAAALTMGEVELRELAATPPYDRWRVRKRSGRWRQIAAPAPRLKAVQRWILHHVTSQLPMHDAAHGCRPGRSIVTNASPHAGAALLVKADIADFFPSIARSRVLEVLTANAIAPDVADVLADLCTANTQGGSRALPQGAPTSPSLANAICLRLDRRLSRAANLLDARYTRYVDDLTFSFAERGDAAALLLEVRRAVICEGFRIAPAKTAIEPASGRQTVTGLVTNDRPRPRRELLRRIRAAVHQSGRADASKLERLRGLIAFVTMTDPVTGKALQQQLEDNTKCTTLKSER